MHEVITKQLEYDLERFQVFPLIHERHENVLAKDETLRLGEALYRTYSSTIWSVVDSPKLVVKYQVLDPLYIEESTLVDLHPLSREFYMIQRIAHLGITPAVYFLSGSVPLPAIKPKKLQFRMSRADWTRNTGHPVRFMVLERLGRGLYQSPPRDFRQAVQYCSEMVRTLQTLHDEGDMIHGDAHSGNWVFAEDGSLKLIDFAAARFVKPASSKTPETHQRSHHMYSPWEMMGFYANRRDDVFKVILTFADFLSGGTLLDWFENLDSIQEHFDAKMSQNFFVLLGDPLINLGASLARQILSSSLSEIAGLVQGMHDVDARPPYEEILLQLDIMTSWLS